MQSDSNEIFYSTSIDDNGSISSLQIWNNGTFILTQRYFDRENDHDWYSVYKSLHGVYQRNDNTITFYIKSEEIQKYKYLFGHTSDSYTTKELNDLYVASVSTGICEEIVTLTIGNKTIKLTRKTSTHSFVSKIAGSYSTEEDTKNQSSQLEMNAGYNLILSPYEYFLLQYHYSDFEGGSMLHSYLGRYEWSGGKLFLHPLVAATQEDAPLSGATDHALTYTDGNVEILFSEDGREIRINSPSFPGHGHLFHRKN